VAEISHDDGDCSITGMGVHRGEGSADLTGIYFASDFCSGRVWGLQQDDAGTWQLEELLDTTLLVTGGGVSQAGDVYLTSCNCAFGIDYDPLADPQGVVWQVVQADEVPEGAETAPLEGEAEASPAPEAASPSPAVSQAPEATAEPPAETEAPSGTEPPAETEAPAESEAPADSEAPAESQVAASGSPSADEGDVVQRRLVASDISFDRDRLNVPAGATVELTLVNRDPVEHNFSVYEDDDAQEPIFQGDLFSGPDAERVYEFQAPEEPGEYHFQCDPHAPQMNGTLVVRERED
jgi:plastocyanin